MTNNAEKKYKTEHPERLPPDYQQHIDDNLADKMRVLDQKMRSLMAKITFKPYKPF